MYSGTYPDKPFYKLLILSPMNRSSSDFDINSFIGGNTPIYMSDFVSIIKDGSLEVIKNRFDHNEKKISLDKLKHIIDTLQFNMFELYFTELIIKIDMCKFITLI